MPSTTANLALRLQPEEILPAQLSEKRAHAVLAYLVQQKIPLTTVDTSGFGETRPVASNDTEEGRRQNRRVDVVVTGEAIGRLDAAGNPAP